MGNKTSILWTPPTRPEWVQRINEEGRLMDIKNIVPLTPQSLIDSAVQSTGLSDFGDNDWYEPFKVVCKSFEEDARFNLLGRIRTRSDLLQFLEARLQIEDTYKRYPEIEDEKITNPLFIVGQGRSGTSFLLNLLGANPDNGVIRMWEAVFPCPPPERATYLTDCRIDRAHKLIDQINRVTPTMASMHEFAGHMPDECARILALSFRADSYLNFLGQVPSFNAYLAQIDQAPALRYHKRVLKLLQWRNPRKQWVLKDPTHLDRMLAILEVYPDAKFIWPHRDPVRALASIVSMVGTSQWGRSDHPFTSASFDYMTDPTLSAQRFNNVIDLLESGRLQKDAVFNLLYQDLVSEPLGIVETLYAALRLPLSPQGKAGMRQYLNEHPRAHRPSHKFDIGSSAEVTLARKAFRRYQDYFGVPDE